MCVYLVYISSALNACLLGMCVYLKLSPTDFSGIYFKVNVYRIADMEPYFNGGKMLNLKGAFYSCKKTIINIFQTRFSQHFYT